MKTPLDNIEEALKAQEQQSSEGVTSAGQLAYIIDPTDPAMAATLRVIEELQKTRGEIALLRFMFMGCPDHPEYRPMDWDGKVHVSPHTECKLCEAIYHATLHYKQTFMKEVDAPIQTDGTAGDGI